MLKIGLCGAGFMGKMHAACYSNIADVKIVAVADLRPAEAGAVAKPTGAKTYAKAADLIAGADVDVVDICLPTDKHCEHVLQAAKRGLDCLCEKPMAYSPAEAARMVKAVRAARTKFMVAHVIRFWPEYQVLKDYVDSKKLGALRELFLRRFAHRPDGYQNWFHDASRSGGALLDLHCHDADFVRYMFGDPKSIDAVGVMNKGGWDQISVNYHYPKVAVNAAGGWWLSGEPFEMAFRAVFEKGTMVYSSRTDPLTLYKPGEQPLKLDVPPPKTAAVNAGGNISSLGGYFNEVKYFTDCLKAGKEPKIVTPEDAAATMKLLYREIASAAKKLAR